MKRINHRSSIQTLRRTLSIAVLTMLFLPVLAIADPWYLGIGLDVMTWSEEGALDSQTYDSLDSTVGATLFVGYRFNGYLSLELFGYQSNSVYLKDSDTDYLEHSMIGLGPRLNLLNIREYNWTPWFSYYGTYHSIDRMRPSSCCDESPKSIHTVMDGMGSSMAMGLDIKVTKDVVLQFAFRESSVWAGWNDSDMDDGETIAEEYLVAVHFNSNRLD